MHKFKMTAQEASVAIAHAFGEESTIDTGISFSPTDDGLGELLVPEQHAWRFENVETKVMPKWVTARMVKAEAARRIEDEYPMWRQLNIMRAGGADLETMSTYIDGVRSASNRLELNPPEDITSDKHWPSL